MSEAIIREIITMFAERRPKFDVDKAVQATMSHLPAGAKGKKAHLDAIEKVVHGALA